ncbi:MAG: hypothetical protein ABSF12_01075 [Bryobacteraceae bacterium]|jgi:AmiR/NasT family two-component response regulator
METSVLKLGVILANGNADDRNCLEAILDGTRWVVVDGGGSEISEVVRDSPVPIVFYIDDHSDRWRDMIPAFRKMRREVCVILLSDSDAPASDEVARRGGFDVLTRPLRREHVLPMLLFAYAYCRGHGSYLSRPRRISRSAVI